jgi:hypothetical protein
VMVHSANGHRTRKGGNSGAPPDLHTTALASHSTEGTHDMSRTALVDAMSASDGLPKVDRTEMSAGANGQRGETHQRVAGHGAGP